MCHFINYDSISYVHISDLNSKLAMDVRTYWTIGLSSDFYMQLHYSYRLEHMYYEAMLQIFVYHVPILKNKI